MHIQVEGKGQVYMVDFFWLVMSLKMKNIHSMSVAISSPRSVLIHHTLSVVVLSPATVHKARAKSQKYTGESLLGVQCLRKIHSQHQQRPQGTHNGSGIVIHTYKWVAAIISRRPLQITTHAAIATN